MKNTLEDIEQRIGQWLKVIPDLPRAGRAWLAVNLWWIVLILAIFSVIRAFAAINAYIGVMAVSSIPGLYNYVPNIALALVTLIAGLIAAIATAILYFRAINPLKEQRLRGWKYVFYAMLINLVFMVIGFIVNVASVGTGASAAALIVGYLFGLIISVAFTGAAFYVLFQVRGEYSGVEPRAQRRAAEAKEADIVETKSAKK